MRRTSVVALIFAGLCLFATVVRAGDDDDDDKGGRHHHPHPPHPQGGGNGPMPEGNYVYRACHEDFEKLCPGFRPSTAKTLFESDCYKTHSQDFSQQCKDALNIFQSKGGDEQVSTSGSTGGTSGSSGVDNSIGTPLYDACKADQVNLCPSLADPWTEADLFEARCFKDNLVSVSPACKNYYEKFLLNQHFLIGIIVSGGVMMFASGILGLIATCCCVACCVRLCVKRRCRSSGRCNSWRRAQTVTAVVDETELVPTNAKSANYEPLQQAEEATAVPQPQFFFPPQHALSPYTAHPQYMQPVFTVSVQQQ